MTSAEMCPAAIHILSVLRISSSRDAPNPALKGNTYIREGIPGIGLVEGAGYQAKGVWRAFEDCRMRTNKASEFYPVCQEAIKEMILFNIFTE